MSDLERRFKQLENADSELNSHFKLAYKYIQKDPQASLNKSRIVLEKIVSESYKVETGYSFENITIAGALLDKKYQSKIGKRIQSKMHSIRTISNLAVHGEPVTKSDARITFDNLCDVVDWYLNNYKKEGSVIIKKNRVGRHFAELLVAVAILAVSATFVFWNTDSKRIETFVIQYEEAIANSLDSAVFFISDPVVYQGEKLSKMDVKMKIAEFIGNNNIQIQKIEKSTIEIEKTKNNLFNVTYKRNFTTDNAHGGTWLVELKIAQYDDNFQIKKIDKKIIKDTTSPNTSK